ncbi:hypothetical protein Daesc_006163 [Daldinia eschscholtzii]|uniref:Pantothenate transporter liz1 n=1 Tax=Daldinia eschscholtzii TaxID=292717 RepID=A0AAX6MG59_9PEZI
MDINRLAFAQRHERTPEERDLVRRLDIFLMAFGCVSQVHWYTPSELAKRMGFYHSCQALGSMMSGALQVAIIETLRDANGLAGWRWLFIINGVMTVVVGASGFFLLPDLPNDVNPRAFWFKKGHARLAMERLERHGRAEPKKMTWAGAKRTFANWVTYFIPVLYIATVLAPWGYAYFNLFLKSLKNPDGTPVWSTSQVNAIPIAGGAINVVFAQAVIGLVPCIAMSIWTSRPDTTPLATAYASYFISYLTLGTAPLIMAWLSDLLPQDPEARTLVVGIAIATYYAVSAWSQVLVWPAVQAPYYKYGWQSSIALWVLVIIMTCVLRYIDFKYLLPRREEFHATLIVGSKPQSPEPTDPELEVEDSPKSPKTLSTVAGA